MQICQLPTPLLIAFDNADRARPFRYGDRWLAAVFNYAPSPINDHMGLQHMHGPHMGTEWWVGRGHLADSSAWSRPFRWQRFWRTSRVLGPHSALNHAPLHWRDPVMNTSSLLWAVDGQWMHVPAWRVGGVYSPANAQFTTVFSSYHFGGRLPNCRSRRCRQIPASRHEGCHAGEARHKRRRRLAVRSIGIDDTG